MYDIFLRPEALPFSIALSVVLGLFLLEILSLMLGGSLLALGSDGPDVDIGLDGGFDGDLDMDFDMEGTLETAADLPDIDADAGIVPPSGVLGWLGVTKVPFLIWLVSFLTLFGLGGLILQSVAQSGFGHFLPVALAALAATLGGLYGARGLSAVVAAIMPKSESSAMKTRFLGGHLGTITQGTARRGKPAEAKIRDRHGNTHYLRVEPLDDDDVIEQGRDVRLIRKRNGRFYVIDVTVTG